MRALAWAAMLMAGGVACLGTGPAAAQKADDTLRIAWRDAVPNLDPYYNALRTGLILSNNAWDTLIYSDPETFQLKPLLATSWRYVDDTTLEFTLRPGVTFHDGSPFTADDVVYTVQVATTDKQVAVPSNYGFIAGAERVDDLHVRIKLKNVFPAALDYIAMVLPILPKAYRERVGAEYGQRPVGTGPYRITNVDGVSSISLERNESYFDGPKGKPAIKRLLIREVADTTEELAMIQGGQADWIWQFSPGDLDTLGRRPDLQVMRQESMRVSYMDMDAAGRTGAGNPLTDEKVRRAIMMAVDREAMSRRFMPGGRALDAPCYPTQFGCDQGAAVHYAYDPAGARKLLADAGYPSGFDTKMVGYLLPQWQAAIQGYLAAVGIRAQVEQLSTADATQRSNEGSNPLDLGSWGSYSINDISAFLPNFFTGGGQDYTRDPEIERLVHQGGATTNPDQRRAAYRAAIQRISEQADFMPLFTDVTTYAVGKDVDFKPFADELPRFYLTRWR
jgi:peptide/nickel transport system substrate-binding protein